MPSPPLPLPEAIRARIAALLNPIPTWVLSQVTVACPVFSYGVRTPPIVPAAEPGHCGLPYMARRLAEGKSTPEVIRCLRRYVAREIYAVLALAHGGLTSAGGILKELRGHRDPN